MINDAPQRLSQQLYRATVECRASAFQSGPATPYSSGLPSFLGEMSRFTVSQHSAQISPRGKKRLCPSVPSSNKGHGESRLPGLATWISFQLLPGLFEDTVSPFLICKMGMIIVPSSESPSENDRHSSVSMAQSSV